MLRLKLFRKFFRNVKTGILQVLVCRLKFSISCVAPIVLGICLGVTINMLYVIFLEVNCYSLKKLSSDDNDNFESHTSQQMGDIDITQSNETRPFYAAKELEMKEKLFVAVLMSPESVNKVGAAIVMTLSKHFPTMVLFSSGDSNQSTEGIPLVEFEDSQPGVLPIQILQYLKENHTIPYDYYLFISDKTYVRAEKYLNLVEHISVSEDVYMGAPGLARKFCTLEGGVLVSFSIMSHILSNLDFCKSNTDPSNPSISLGTCVHHATKKICTSHSVDKELKYYDLQSFDYDQDIERLSIDTDFNEALSFYPVPDDRSFYKLNRYFCQRDLAEIGQKIEEAKAKIIDSSKFYPGAFESLIWPIGASPSHKPEDQFSVMDWTYFNDKHMYHENEFDNFNEISNMDKRDLDDIKNVTVEYLNMKYGSLYQIKKIINGYRRFDSTRGMEYILDLSLSEGPEKETKALKRVHLLRPLGYVQQVPMPEFSTAARIDIIVPLRAEHVSFFDVFIVTFAITCLQSKENVTMTVVFLYSDTSKNLPSRKDPFNRPKTLINDYSMKYNQKGKLTWKALPDVFTDIDIIDDLQSQFKTDSLIFVTTVNMEMILNCTNLFLERIRLHTIKEHQVFFPIGFQQYRPNIIYESKPFPSSVGIGQRLGFWDIRSGEYASFYLCDYQTARKALGNSTKPPDIFSMFITYQQFHVFRAIEPNLKLKWMNLTCDPRMLPEKCQECETRNLERLASQRHLALLLYEYLTKPTSSKVKLKDLIRHW